MCKLSLIATLNTKKQEGIQSIERERNIQYISRIAAQSQQQSNQLLTLLLQCLIFPINEPYFKIIYVSERPKFRVQKLYWTHVGKFNHRFLSLDPLTPRGAQELNKNIYLEKMSS